MKASPGPAYAKQLLTPLRASGLALPGDDVASAIRIASIDARRPDVFRKHPGAGSKASSRWGMAAGPGGEGGEAGRFQLLIRGGYFFALANCSSRLLTRATTASLRRFTLLG